MQNSDREEKETYRSTEDLQSSITKHKIDEIISKAVAAFPDKPQMSNHKRVSDIKANRKEEIERQYQESVRKKDNPITDPPAPTSGKSLIQQMLEQELNESYGLT